jgi:hypothetical protein
MLPIFFFNVGQGQGCWDRRDPTKVEEEYYFWVENKVSKELVKSENEVRSPMKPQHLL